MYSITYVYILEYNINVYILVCVVIFTILRYKLKSMYI